MLFLNIILKMCTKILNSGEVEDILKITSIIESSNKEIKSKLDEYENTNKKRNMMFDKLLNSNTYLIQDSIKYLSLLGNEANKMSNNESDFSQPKLETITKLLNQGKYINN